MASAFHVGLDIEAGVISGTSAYHTGCGPQGGHSNSSLNLVLYICLRIVVREMASFIIIRGIGYERTDMIFSHVVGDHTPWMFGSSITTM